MTSPTTSYVDQGNSLEVDPFHVSSVVVIKSRVIAISEKWTRKKQPNHRQEEIVLRCTGSTAGGHSDQPLWPMRGGCKCMNPPGEIEDGAKFLDSSGTCVCCVNHQVIDAG